jgi:drug/metabolite transporter (DMT)-like permease
MKASPVVLPPRLQPDVPRVPGALLLTVAALLFGVMATLAKRAAVRLPGPEVAFVRFVVGMAACAAAATRIRMRASNWTGLFLRGAFGGAAVLCYFLAIEHLPVGMATLLNYTAPVFTALWAVLFLDEAVGAATFGALALTTIGVALVIKGNARPGTLGLGRWELVGVCSAVLSGAAVATIREVRKTDGSWEIFAAFCIVGALVTAPPTVRSWVTPSAAEWAMLLGVGAISVVAQILMTYALGFVRAAVAGVLFQLTPVAALVLGRILYGERTAGLAIAGAALTLAGVTWGARLAMPRATRSIEVEER